MIARQSRLKGVFMYTSVNEWQIQEAKNKLSHLVKEAGRGFPQYITVYGKNTAVILSTKEYEKLKRPGTRLSEILLAPLIDEEEELFARNRDTGRNLDL